MNDEDMIDPSKLQVPNENAQKVITFFKGEADEKFIEQEQLVDVVEYAFSLKATIEEAEEKYEKAVAEIKRRLDADKLESKVVKDFGDRKCILTPKDGSAKVDYEKYITDMIGEKSVTELAAMKQDAKDGRETKYVTLGKPSVSLEIV